MKQARHEVTSDDGPVEIRVSWLPCVSPSSQSFDAHAIDVTPVENQPRSLTPVRIQTRE